MTTARVVEYYTKDGSLEVVAVAAPAVTKPAIATTFAASRESKLRGLDVHSYTSSILDLIKSLGPTRAWYGYSMRTDYDAYMKQAQTKYAVGTTAEYQTGLGNIASHIKTGIDKDQVVACDPELPGINFIYFFIELVKLLDKTQDAGQIALFQDCVTLIGSTCVQGVSHRLWQLYNSLILDAT